MKFYPLALFVTGWLLMIVGAILLLYPQVIWICGGDCCYIGYPSAYKLQGYSLLILGVAMVTAGVILGDM